MRDATMASGTSSLAAKRGFRIPFAEIEHGLSFQRYLIEN